MGGVIGADPGHISTCPVVMRMWEYAAILPSLSPRVMVAVLVDCPHEPQFLPSMDVMQSASLAAGRVTHKSQPFAQLGEVLDGLDLKVVA